MISEIGRPRSRGRPKYLVIAAPRREGRVIRQARRAFIACGRPLTMTELREWCFAGQERKHWQYWSITRALRRLGARSLGRAGRAGIWVARSM
jgi:hypothetical protein